MDPSSSKSSAKISGKMHLLVQRCHIHTIGTLPQVINDVYNNFISMANVIEHTSPNRIWEIKYLMGFIRSALKWCLFRGVLIDRSLFDALTCIEADFINVSQLPLSSPSSDESGNVELHGDRRFGLYFVEQNILDAYLYIWKHCVPSTSMFTEESVMERLNQAIEDDMKHKKQAVVLKKFIHFIKESTDQASLEDILPWVDYLLDMMMCYFFHSNMEEPFDDVTNRIDAAIDCIVLHILVWHSDAHPPFTGELMAAYIECIQTNLTWVRSEVYCYIAEQTKQQIIIIHDLVLGLSLVSDQEKLSLYTTLMKIGCSILFLFAFEFDEDKTRSRIQICKAFEGVFWKSRFDEDLVSVARVVFYKWSEYHIDQEMLLNGRREMVDVLRGLGLIIYSTLNNEVESRTGTEMSFGLPELHFKFERVKELTRMIFVKIFICSTLQAPQTDLLGFLSFFLENLEELRVRNFDLFKDWKDQLETIQENLLIFKSFLQKNKDKSIRCYSSQQLSLHIRNAAYDAEYIINAFTSGAFHEWTRSILISGLIEQFNLIKKEVKTAEMVIETSSEVLPHEPVPTTNLDKVVIHAASQVSVLSTDVIMGFEVVTKLLMERLASHNTQLDVISVVGMGGIGKTTLAKKVYEDPYTINHFQLRAWCVVSHDYDEKDLLLRILGTDGDPEKSYGELGDLLHKKLMGRRYLIVLDDVWDIDAFYCLKRFLPDVSDGSRIVLTSRALLTGKDSNTIKLNLLSADESWNILKAKVYQKEKFPVELLEIGKRIAKKCGGLPLAVVVVAGLLAKSDKDEDVWKKIAERLSIYSDAGDSQGEGMKALDLSYEFLPDHLKPLFLYVGAFPEDRRISTKTLKRLWNAEGFLRKSEERSQEDQAEIYLMDLIDRSLLMVDERKSNGLVKTCRIHDLMRDMALSKAKAEGFLQCVRFDELLSERVIFERRVRVRIGEGSAAPHLAANDDLSMLSQLRLITYDDLSMLSIPSCVNSVLVFTPCWLEYKLVKGDPILKKHEMLKVFLMVDYGLQCTDDVTLPVHLRYISCVMKSSKIPPSIFSLWDLETLYLHWIGKGEIRVPGEVWKMTKLRNLHISRNVGGFRFSEAAGEEESCRDKLENLQTLSWLEFNTGEDTNLLIGRFPNVVKLKCLFYDNSDYNNSRIWTRLESLHKLQSINLIWSATICYLPSKFISLPPTLKKLTLRGSGMKWKDISMFQQLLPNLEILKLNDSSVSDELWNMEDGVFPKLKFLQLYYLKIKQWIASAENFPCLQNLVLGDCWNLEEIPCGFGEIDSLEKIRVERCSHSASESAKCIEQVQIEEFGNHLLKVYVSHPYPKW